MQRKQFGVKQIKGGETALSCHVWTLFTLPRKRRDSDVDETRCRDPQPSTRPSSGNPVEERAEGIREQGRSRS
ncbi:hypothetical protein LEMLEM_LOCUS7056 [Lemmus lemmus]